jgi:DNA-binding NarL/FixJ family response regulator
MKFFCCFIEFLAKVRTMTRFHEKPTALRTEDVLSKIPKVGNTMKVSHNETTVLLADDHPVVSYGLHQALEAAPDFHVVAEVRDGLAALAGLREYQPRIAVLDIDMPQLDGFRVAAAAQAEGLPSKIVFLSVYNEAGFLKKALRLDARGYILKDNALAEIVAGLRTIAQGLPYFSPGVMEHLLHPRSSASRALDPSADLSVELAHLTPTERAILKLIADCCTTKEIAAHFFISPRTVETHRANMCQKLGVRGNHALTKFALAHRGQLDPSWL